MWSARVLPFLLVAVALTAPLVAAEPAQVDATVVLPLRAAGHSLLAADAPVLLLQGTDGVATWSLAAPSLQLAEVEYWEQVTDAPDGLAPQSGVRARQHDLSAATIAVDARAPGFTALAWGDDAQADTAVRAAGGDIVAQDPAWTARPDMRVFRLAAPLVVSAPVGNDAAPTTLVLGRPAPFDFTVESGALHAQAARADHRLIGPLEGYLHGATVTVRHSQGTLPLLLGDTIEERPGSLYVPEQGWTGPGTHKERIVRYLQWSADAARLTVATDATSAALFAAVLDLQTQGHLGVALAQGTLTLGDGTPRPIEAESLVLSGAIAARLSGAERADQAQLSGSGDVSYVRVGGASESFPISTAVAAMAGLALLAGAAMAIWHTLPGALPLFSRVQKDDVLDHKTRAEIYELVRSAPGVTPHGVVEATNVGWSTVMYHLTVLERSEMVVALKDGRYRRYFDRTSGRFANGRKDIVAALRNETTAAIACHIRDHPGLVQRRLAEAFSLAASSVHWHVARLVKTGLVEKRREARAVLLVPGPGWEKLDPEDLAAVLAR